MPTKTTSVVKTVDQTLKRPAAKSSSLQKKPATRAVAEVAAPDVEAEPPKPKPTKRNLEEDLKNADGKEDPADSKKGQPSKNATVIEEIEYPCGWMAYKYKTQKGREYWKYVQPDGVYYFSAKLARMNGFEAQAES